MTHWFEGDFVAAQRHLQQALAIYDAARDRELVFRFGQDVASPAMVFLALVFWPLGVFDRAGSLNEEAVIHALGTAHVPTILYAYACAAIFEMMRRDRSATAPHVEALLDIAREHSIPLWIAFGTFQEGWVRAGVADRDAGIAKMREGITLLRSQLLGTFMPLLMTLLAETEAEAGRPEAALAIVDEQLAIAEQTGQRWYLAELHRARGEILLKRRPCDEAAAESAFARAIDIAQTQSAKLFELQAAVSLGRLWLAQGRCAHARELVAPVCAWLNTGPDCNALSEARVLMRNLTAM